MSIPLIINGTTYDYPVTGDIGWGPDATAWASGVTVGMLQKAGGLFQLLAEVDFGTSFGLKSLYYKSRTANPADSGQVRFGVTDVLNWRNNANSGNLSLAIDASDNLTFNGAILQSFTISDSSTIDLSLAGNVLSADIIAGSITNSLINASAAIAFSKLAALTSAHILVGSAGNVATDVAVTGDISIGNTGVTAYVGTLALNKGGTGQTTKAAAFDALSPMSASGDIIYGGTAGTGTRLPKGSDGQIFTLVSGLPAWVTASSGNLAITSQTSTYAIQLTDAAIFLNATGGGFTSTLPTAVGNAGKVYYVEKVIGDVSANIATIAPFGAQTIGGYAFYTLATPGEAVMLISDNVNWLVLNHYTNTAPTIFTMTIGGTTGAPTKGTIVFDVASWTRRGVFMDVRYDYRQSAAGNGGGAGAVYTFPTAGYTIGGSVTPDTGGRFPTVGYGRVSNNTSINNSTQFTCLVVAFDTTNLALVAMNSTSILGYIAQGNGSLNGELSISYSASVPINGWLP